MGLCPLPSALLHALLPAPVVHASQVACTRLPASLCPWAPTPWGGGEEPSSQRCLGPPGADRAAMGGQAVSATLVLLGKSRSRSPLEAVEQQSSLIFSAVIELHEGGRDGGAVF